jgi:hypothetical protein
MISEKSPTSSVFDIDDQKLIEKFVQGSNQLLASENLRLEVNGGVSQLLTRNGEAIAMMYLQNSPRTVVVKHSSEFLELIDRLLIDRDFVMFGDASRAGFIEYRHYITPAGYRIWYTEPSILWKKWWPTERFQDKQRFNMNILVNFKNNWYPVQNISVSAGTFSIKTIAGQLALKRNDKVLWLAQITQDPAVTMTGNLQIESTSTPIEQPAVVVGFKAPLSSEDLAKKIQQKQLDMNPAQALMLVKELENKLQDQIKSNIEIQDQFNQLEGRAIVAEQRLQIVYKYLQEIGVNPRDIYAGKKTSDN